MNRSLMLKSISFFVLLALSQVAIAKPVGTVIFSAGDVTISHADKTVTKAEKNAELNSGDAIETKEGRVQLSMIDGGKISLQPNTIYKINQFEFTGKEDGSEYNFTELVKGGLRTISGLIGHKNHDHYQLKTAVATIGIRGTEFTVNFNDNNLLMTTNHGSVDVCNAGGCLNAITGQSIQVAGIGGAPKPSNKAAKAAAAPPPAGKAVFAAGEQINTAALITTLVPVTTTPTQTPTSPVPSGAGAAGSSTVYAGATNGVTHTYITGMVDLVNNPVTATNKVTLNNGNITSLNNGPIYSMSTSTKPAETGSDSTLGIYWSMYSSGFTITDALGSGSNGSYHTMYTTQGITGTELLNMQTLANTSIPSLLTATYSTVFGHTSPTDMNGTTGSLNSLSIGVNFRNQTITKYDLNATVSGNVWTASLPLGLPVNISIFSTLGIPLVGTCTSCVIAVGSANGNFSGSQAQGLITS